MTQLSPGKQRRLIYKAQTIAPRIFTVERNFAPGPLQDLAGVLIVMTIVRETIEGLRSFNRDRQAALNKTPPPDLDPPLVKPPGKVSLSPSTFSLVLIRLSFVLEKRDTKCCQTDLGLFRCGRRTARSPVRPRRSRPQLSWPAHRPRHSHRRKP